LKFEVTLLISVNCSCNE